MINALISRNNLRYIIVGTGRSGTKYTSYNLNLNDIVCGHENIFNPEKAFPEKDNKFIAESSWLAVPYLKYYTDLKLYHVVRDPVKVIESYVNRGFFSGEDPYAPSYKKFLIKHLPEISDISDSVEASIFHVVEWSKLIKKVVGTKFYKLETDFVELLEDIGIQDPKIYQNKKFNTNIRTKYFKLNLSSVKDPYRKMIYEHMEEYGYNDFK